MRLLTQYGFISLFDGENSYSFETFLKNAQVRTNARLTPLKQYMKKHNIKNDDVRIIYKHIVNRDDYLTRFFATSLYTDEIGIRSQEPMKSNFMNNNALVK